MIVLLRTIARRHHEDTIEIVTSRETRFEPLEDVPNIRIRRIRLTGLMEADRLLVGFFYLRKIVREAKADILWSMNLGPYVKMPVPYILSVQNPYQVYPWNYARYHPRSGLSVAFLRLSFRCSLRLSDSVIVQTEIMKNYLHRVRGAPRNILVVPKAVERAIDIQSVPLPSGIQSTLQSGLGYGVFTFLYVATFMPHKNHITLVRAFSLLALKNIRARVIFTVKPQEIMKEGGTMAAELVEKGYIVPVGWVDKPYLRSLYRAADACLMPSMLESLSSAHIEAMKWGKPQIAANLAYAHDICGTAALYADATNVYSWVEQIERLVNDETLRLQLIDAGRKRMNSFPSSWDQVAEHIYQFLKFVRCRQEIKNT